MRPTGFNPLPRRVLVLLAPYYFDFRTVAVADLDALGGDPHVGLPRPAQHGHGEVGFLGAVGEDPIRVVIHAERDPVAAVLDHLVDLFLEVAGEELEGTSLSGVTSGEHVSHHTGQLVATVVVLGVPKDSCPPDTSSCASGGGGLEGLFHEGEVHCCSLGSRIVPVQAILRITQEDIIVYSR